MRTKKKTADYDIIIVGAGPAGATLARCLPQNYRILVIDKKPLNQEIDRKKMKCCGALLSESAQKVMAEMGLNLPTELLIEPQTFALRVMDLNYPIERKYQKHYYNMDRAKFENWLIGLIPEGVERKGNTYVKDFHRCQNGVELIVKDRTCNKEKAITCKMVVAADGASSLFRKRLYPGIDRNKYVSIQEWYENIGKINNYAAIIDEEITDYYSWLIPKEDAIVLGAAFDLDKTPGSPNQRFMKLKEKLEAKGLRFGKRIHREGCEIIRPDMQSIVTGNNRIAFIGEAGGFISPSSSEGFSYAFRTARMLAEAIRRKGCNRHAEDYARRAQKLKGNLLVRKLKATGMYAAQIRRLVLRSGFGSI